MKQMLLTPISTFQI